MSALRTAPEGSGNDTSALPLAVLKDAALGKVLPAHLRRQVAVAAWTRAVLLDDDDTAKATAPALLELLPEMKAQLTAYLDVYAGRAALPLAAHTS